MSNYAIWASPLPCEKLDKRVGTPGYAAPEMLLATKKKTYDARCDLFALGVILFVLLGATTLFDPMGDASDAILASRIKQGKWQFHDEAWAKISSEAKEVVSKLLEVKLMTGGTWMMCWRRRGSPGARHQYRSATTSGCAPSIRLGGPGPPRSARPALVASAPVAAAHHSANWNAVGRGAGGIKGGLRRARRRGYLEASGDRGDGVPTGDRNAFGEASSAQATARFPSRSSPGSWPRSATVRGGPRRVQGLVEIMGPSTQPP